MDENSSLPLPPINIEVFAAAIDACSAGGAHTAATLPAFASKAMVLCAAAAAAPPPSAPGQEDTNYRAQIAAAVDAAPTPEAQIAASDGLPLLLDKVTGRFTLAPYVPPPPMNFELPTLNMAESKIFARRGPVPPFRK